MKHICKRSKNYLSSFASRFISLALALTASVISAPPKSLPAPPPSLPRSKGVWKWPSCPLPLLSRFRNDSQPWQRSGQMGDADHLVVPGNVSQLFRYLLGRAPADSGVDLVKNQSRYVIGIRQHSLNGQHDPGQLTTGATMPKGFKASPGFVEIKNSASSKPLAV